MHANRRERLGSAAATLVALLLVGAFTAGCGPKGDVAGGSTSTKASSSERSASELADIKRRSQKYVDEARLCMGGSQIAFSIAGKSRDLMKAYDSVRHDDIIAALAWNPRCNVSKK